MNISIKDWQNYISKLSKLSATAAEKMQRWVQENGFADTDALIGYAYALATKYGEGAAELACQMYDAIAEMQAALVPPAIPASTASWQETAIAVEGAMNQSPSGQLISSTVQRLVKQAGADTMLTNANRDGSEFAWVPFGDTCAFCITLASRGWQRSSRKALKNGHAEHIHGNCDCEYAVRFDGTSGVSGYDPQKYADMYYGAEGVTPQEK